MVLLVRHRQGLRKACGLAAATHPDCYPGLNQAANSSFWDIQTSGQTKSAGGTGKTTAQMHAVKTFLAAGWDFVGETANGADDTWWIDEGKDYPRLWWELEEGAKSSP